MSKGIQDHPGYSHKLIPPTSTNGITKSEFVISCNFDKLAALYPELDSARKQSTQQASSTQSAFNPSSDFNKALTQCLLRHHFDLQLPSLPEGRLCPPVPNRANYVCWLRELVSSSSHELERFAGGRIDGMIKVKIDDNYVQHANNNYQLNNKAELQYQGIDIGTGVSAIYPLLLSTELFARSEAIKDWNHKPDKISCNNASEAEQKPSTHQEVSTWKFMATDIDPLAIKSARINVKANSLEDQICVVQVNSPDRIASNKFTGPLFTAMLEARSHSMFKPSGSFTADTKDFLTYPKFDFIMTNPPFYSTKHEATTPRAGDKRSRTEMTSNEAIYKSYDVFDYDNRNSTDTTHEGGDVGFITDIIKDSQSFRHHVTWYTSLVAKRASLDTLLRILQTLDGVWGNRGQIRTVEFRQGSSTHLGLDQEKNDDPMRCSPRVRWGIAWTYERSVSRCDACRITTGLTSFNVSLSEDDVATYKQDASFKIIHEHASVYCAAVVSRLTTYFESFRETPLKSSEQLKNKKHCVTVIEERFSNPDCIKRQEDNNNLPYDGHFVIDAFVSISDAQTDQCSIEVTLHMYSHTKYGNALIDRIRNPMPGEIGRTNRRWRRLKKNTANHYLQPT